jgi:UDP-galactopyranose mutase
MTKKEILIVGAGFSGATVARLLADTGHKVLMIDRRDHVAGNAHDYINTLGIRVHSYGPHIFHTSNSDVVNFLSRFTDWTEYRHKVRARLADGREVVMPPNRETAEIIGKEHIIETLFRPYTRKMWGVEIDELDPSILQRVLVRDDLNDAYFPNDSFQAMPKDGYTALIEAMLDHPSITIQLKTEFTNDLENRFLHVFNSMPIDEYFDFHLGELPYRSIRFHTVDLPHPSLNSVPTVNFTHDGPHTRVTEWKKFPGHGVNPHWTTLTFEEPCDYRDNFRERFYPVKDIGGDNRALYKHYASMSPDHMTFIGRCGLYVYLDMHQAVSSALAIGRRFLGEK